MILGITGCPGSGKSILAYVLVQQGWILVNADEIGHDVVEHDSDILGKLGTAFGSDIISFTGILDRRLLAKRAFENPETTRTLNTIVHPPLIKRLKAEINEVRCGHEHCVVDCALIFEWGIEKFFDIVVCVSADEDLRKKRLMKRDGRSWSEIDGLFSAQLSECEKMRRADIVTANNNSVEKLKLFGMLLAELPRYFKESEYDRIEF